MQHDTVGDEHRYAHETEPGADGHHEWNYVKFSGRTRHVYDDTNAERFVQYSVVQTVVFELVGKPCLKKS